jgi:hypothetical protein
MTTTSTTAAALELERATPANVDGGGGGATTTTTTTTRAAEPEIAPRLSGLARFAMRWGGALVLWGLAVTLAGAVLRGMMQGGR